MTAQELTILLPCHSLEDFPLYHQGEDAAALLAAWSAPWHPALLAHFQKLPGWCRCDEPPEDLAQRLFIHPTTHGCDLPEGFGKRVKDAGGQLIRKLSDRIEISRAALTAAAVDVPECVSPAVIDDFYALASCYLHTELLTRRMRYMSLLDEVRFQDAVLAAAATAVRGDDAALQTELQSAFDQLLQSRNHFYPVDCYLLDLVLLAPQTLGPALHAELLRSTPLNLICDGATLQELAAAEPESLRLIQQRMQDGSLSLLGGCFHEGESALQTVEEIAADLAAARRIYLQHLGCPPHGYARRRDGLTPLLPQLLKHFDFHSALHVTLDDGRFPTGNRSRTSWQGWGAAAIESLARVPAAARDPAVMLNLPEKLGETMDYDHTAMLAWVRWPGEGSPFYNDLRRGHQFAPVLGKFVTWREYFQETGTSSEAYDWSADEYRTAYLFQDVVRRTPDPLTRHKTAQAIEHRTGGYLQSLAEYARGQSIAVELPEAAPAALARCLGFTPQPNGGEILVLNPNAGPRRQLLEWPSEWSLPTISGAVLAAERTAQHSQVLVEVPGFGFACISPGAATVAKQEKRGWGFWSSTTKSPESIVRAEERRLVNEYCDVTLSAETGTIVKLWDGRTRGNRLSQQLGIRLGDGADTTYWEELPDYSIMAADELTVSLDSPLCGEFTSCGRLLNPQGEVLARFLQRTRLVRLQAVVEIELELELLTTLRAEPWKSYAAVRWAWGDDLTQVHRSLHESSQRADAKRIEAPDFTELRDPHRVTSLLFNGLPYHQRVGARRLDTLLAVKGETSTRFRLGIALDSACTARSARHFAQACDALRGNSSADKLEQGWLLHLDSKGTLLTGIDPIYADQRVIGLSCRVQETTGQAGPVTLRGIRPWKQAEKINAAGEPQEQLEVHHDQVRFFLAAYEWCELRVLWGAA